MSTHRLTPTRTAPSSTQLYTARQKKQTFSNNFKVEAGCFLKKVREVNLEGVT